MILGIDELLRRVKEENLVENLSERELTNPEGAGFDLRIGRVFRLTSQGFLGVDERETPKVELAASYDPARRQSFTMKPGEYFLTETVETFRMPLDVLAIAKPRTTLHRSGILTRVSVVDPGYSGTIHPALFNAGPAPFVIELGARYINVMFFEIKGVASAYRGQWQGGRTTTQTREAQV